MSVTGRNTNNSMQAALNPVRPPAGQSLVANIIPFDGNPQMLEFFISQIKDYGSINKYDDKTLLFAAKTRLKGQALEFIIQKIKAQPINSSKDFFACLCQQFALLISAKLLMTSIT